jgi:hypothetical protein
MDLYQELGNSSKEIFRFEALQEYFSDGSDALENEINRQWKEKGEIDMDLMKEWHGFIKRKVKSGVKMIWVKLAEFPLKDYTLASLYIYKRRVKYGIDIRIITKEKIDALKIAIKDFYLLDRKNVLLMNYGKFNEYFGCELDKNLEKYTQYRNLLIENSVSVFDFNY